MPCHAPGAESKGHQKVSRLLVAGNAHKTRFFAGRRLRENPFYAGKRLFCTAGRGVDDGRVYCAKAL